MQLITNERARLLICFICLMSIVLFFICAVQREPTVTKVTRVIESPTKIKKVTRVIEGQPSVTKVTRVIEGAPTMTKVTRVIEGNPSITTNIEGNHHLIHP